MVVTAVMGFFPSRASYERICLPVYKSREECDYIYATDINVQLFIKLTIKSTPGCSGSLIWEPCYKRLGPSTLRAAVARDAC